MQIRFVAVVFASGIAKVRDSSGVLSVGYKCL